jgi:hypothetical protein
MPAKQLLSGEEAQGVFRGSNRWNVVLDKQWSAPTLLKGGLRVRKRPTEPPRHWPSPSSGMRGGS